jgi:hypothetical protein
VAQRSMFALDTAISFSSHTHPTTQGICAGGIGGWFLAASFGFGLSVVLAFWSSPRPSLCVRSSCCLLQLPRALLVTAKPHQCRYFQRYFSSSRVARRKMYLACFGIGNSFCNNLFVGSHVLLRDCFIMLLPCHLGACLAVAPAAAAAGCLRSHGLQGPTVRLTTLHLC